VRRWAIALFMVVTFGAAPRAGFAGCSDYPAPGVNWSGCSKVNRMMAGYDFRGANLENADLSRSDLTGANFINANLRKANFARTQLKVAMLTGALLEKATLDRA